MDLKELLKKFYDAGIMAEATLEEKYSFEQTLADNSEALQLLQTGVSISLVRAKKYARHQHFLGTQGKELVEFEDWKQD